MDTVLNPPAPRNGRNLDYELYGPPPGSAERRGPLAAPVASSWDEYRKNRALKQQRLPAKTVVPVPGNGPSGAERTVGPPVDRKGAPAQEGKDPDKQEAGRLGWRNRWKYDRLEIEIVLEQQDADWNPAKRLAPREIRQMKRRQMKRLGVWMAFANEEYHGVIPAKLFRKMGAFATRYGLWNVLPVPGKLRSALDMTTRNGEKYRNVKWRRETVLRILGATAEQRKELEAVREARRKHYIPKHNRQAARLPYVRRALKDLRERGLRGSVRNVQRLLRLSYGYASLDTIGKDLKRIRIHRRKDL